MIETLRHKLCRLRLEPSKNQSAVRRSENIGLREPQLDNVLLNRSATNHTEFHPETYIAMIVEEVANTVWLARRLSTVLDISRTNLRNLHDRC